MTPPPFETAANLEAASGIRHGFFGRKGPEGGLDVSANFSAPGIAEANRHLAMSALGADNLPLAILRQVHSTHVVIIGAPPDPASHLEADGLVTALSGIALGIVTADCAPILFADPGAGVIGACHAGWKGAVGAIAGNTVDAMVALGATRSRIVAAIGPTISGPNYEVGPDFARNLRSMAPDAAPFIFIPSGGDREHFDLPAYLRSQLDSLGLAAVEHTGGCTYADPERYFSHRHSTHTDAPEGRQISIILRG